MFSDNNMISQRRASKERDRSKDSKGRCLLSHCKEAVSIDSVEKKKPKRGGSAKVRTGINER